MASSSQLIEVTIIHGNNKHNVKVGTPSPDGLPTIHNLKDAAERVTGIPAASQRVIFKGKTLKDPGQMLCEVGIEPHSRVMIIGQKPQDNPACQAVQTVAQKAENIEGRLRSLQEEVQGVANGYLPSHLHVDALKRLSRQCGGLGEELMKALESLDAMSIDSSQEVARAKKKATVRQIQAILDRVDALSAQISSLQRSPRQ